MPKHIDLLKPTPLRLWGPFLFWVLLIFAFSAYPKAIIPQSKYFSWDKLAHLVEFGILGYLAARAIRFSGLRWLAARYGWITIIFGLLYAISDELHQLYVKGRYASVYDVIADFVGVLLGCLVFTLILRSHSGAPATAS
ncbi:MAG TPA: VanZ family protein [bacterium]